MAIKTHEKIDKKLCGKVVSNKDDEFAQVKLKTDKSMIVDEKGLIHGGFIFGAADYAAMISINHPNVVLAEAKVKFIKPVIEGDILTFNASVYGKDGKKRKVKVEGYNQSNEIVFSGEFLCIIPEKHVLER